MLLWSRTGAHLVFLWFGVAVKLIRAAWESRAHRNTELKRAQQPWHTVIIQHTNTQHCSSIAACQSAAVKSRTEPCTHAFRRSGRASIPHIPKRARETHRCASTATVSRLASLEPIPMMDVGRRHAPSGISTNHKTSSSMWAWHPVTSQKRTTVIITTK